MREKTGEEMSRGSGQYTGLADFSGGERFSNKKF